MTPGSNGVGWALGARSSSPALVGQHAEGPRHHQPARAAIGQGIRRQVLLRRDYGRGIAPAWGSASALVPVPLGVTTGGGPAAVDGSGSICESTMRPSRFSSSGRADRRFRRSKTSGACVMPWRNSSWCGTRALRSRSLQSRLPDSYGDSGDVSSMDACRDFAERRDTADSDFVTRAVPEDQQRSWIRSDRGERTSSQPLASPRPWDPWAIPDSATEIVAVDETAGIIVCERLERDLSEPQLRDSTNPRI